MIETLIDKYAIQANKESKKVQLALKTFLGFCKTFEKIAEKLGYHIVIKTANLQKFIYTTVPNATDINVTFEALFF